MDHRSYAQEVTETTPDPATNALRVHLRRIIPAARGAVFAACTDRAAWNEWMRLRARARATLAPHAGGAFRLELAEGPRIHLITGVVREVRFGEAIELSWLHQDVSSEPSLVELTFRSVTAGTEVTLTHSRIVSRRHAAWLARTWATMLDRLRAYVVPASSSRQVREHVMHGSGPSAGDSRIALTV